MDYKALKKIVDDREFDRLVGEIENVYFDCKGEPYKFENERKKFELAKDVSSFANSKGGFIFIGIETEKKETHRGDEVTRIRPFKQSLVDTGQYRDIISEWIYPTIDNLDINWFAYKGSFSKGVVVIEIPEQNPSKLPFLVNKIVTEDDKKTDILFNYAKRIVENTQYLKVAEIQNLLHRGLFYEESLELTLQNIESTILQGLQSERSSEDTEQKLSERIENALKDEDFVEKRTLILSAFIGENKELQTIFNPMEDENSVRWKLAHPPENRTGGWNLRTLSIPQIMEGKYIRA